MGAHLSEASLRFLRGLKRHNDRTWFNERKSVYERELKQPFSLVIEEINEAMLRFAPTHVRAPEKTMMRIYRDIRFSPDKRPYKTRVGAWWVRQGLEKTSGGGFYLEVSPEQVQIAAGVFMPDRVQLLAIRNHIVANHARLRTALQARGLKTVGLAAMSGNPLTRPPKGFAEHEAAMDLLLHREWGVSGSFPTAMAMTPSFAADVARRFQRSVALVDLLNEPLVSRPKSASFEPFALL